MGVEAFIHFAEGKGTLTQFLGAVQTLGQENAGISTPKNAVTISTIHRAKGREWEVVFIPECNDEIIPFEGERSDNIEEERRLFYVAITRTKRDLYLYCVRSKPISPFLKQANWQTVLDDMAHIQAMLADPPQRWQGFQVRNFVQRMAVYKLKPYFAEWWQIESHHQQTILVTICQFLSVVANHNLWQTLGIEATEYDWWRTLLSDEAFVPATTFPGLEEYLPKPSKVYLVEGEEMPAFLRQKTTGEKILLIKTFSQTPTPNNCHHLACLLADPSKTVQTMARINLQKIGGLDTVRAIDKFLGQPFGTNSRQDVIKILSTIGAKDPDPKAKEEAKRILQEDVWQLT
jgi:DNA helicase-2/ATP-dependent DNA helicase PcrA